MARGARLGARAVLLAILVGATGAAEVQAVSIVDAVKRRVQQLKGQKEEREAAEAARSGPTFTLSRDAELLTSASDASLLSVSEDGATLRYSDRAEQVGALRPGAILLSSAGAGFIRKVVSVSHAGSEYVVETADAALEEAFESLHLRVSHEFQPSPSQALRLGGRAPQAELEASFRVPLPSIRSHGVKLDGSVAFTAKVEGEIDIDFGVLRRFKFGAAIEQSSELELALEGSINRPITLATFPLGVVPCTPPMQVVYSLELVPEANLGEASLSLSDRTKYHGHITYEGGAWTSGSGRELRPGGKAAFTKQGEARLALRPKLSARFGGIAGPYLSGELPYFRATVKAPAQHLPYEVAAGVQAYAGVEAKLLRTTIAKYETPLFGDGVEKVFLTGVTRNAEPAIAGVSASAASAPAGAKVSLTCGASDPDGDSLSYAWEASGGSMAPDGRSAIWTAPSRRGTYELACAVADGWGGKARRAVQVAVANGPPALAKADGAMAAPAFGDESTLFAFQIRYADPDGDAPAEGYPRVRVLDGGSELAGSPFPMALVSGTFADGALYRAATRLPAGTYRYFFEAADGAGASVAYPASAEERGQVSVSSAPAPSSGGAEPAGHPYWPLAAGNAWSYSGSVSGWEEIPDAFKNYTTTLRLQSAAGGKFDYVQEASAEGIPAIKLFGSLLLDGGRVIDPATRLVALEAALSPGQVWSAPLVVEGLEPGTFSATVLSLSETVETPAGRYAGCAKIRYETTNSTVLPYPDGQERRLITTVVADAYFAPGVGPVRWNGSVKSAVEGLELDGVAMPALEIDMVLTRYSTSSPAGVSSLRARAASAVDLAALSRRLAALTSQRR